MERRSYLKSIGAAVAGGLIVGGLAHQPPTNPVTEQDPPPSQEPAIFHNPGETDSDDREQSSCAATHRGISFDCVRNAVEDLNMDSTGSDPVDDKLTVESGTLIEFPPGTYRFEKSHVAEEVLNWGVRGLGSRPSDVRFFAPPGMILRLFNIRSGRNVLMENITFDQRETRQGSLGNVVRVADGLQLHNLKHAGFEPSDQTGTVSLLHPLITSPDGVGVIDGYDVRMGFEEAPYPNNGLSFWAGPPHKGTLTIRNIHLENLPGLYMSRTEGDVRVENCFFRNNDSSAIRVCGEGSYIKDTTIEIDVDNSYNVVNEHDHNQGVRWESGQFGKTGGYMENVEIICKSVNRSSGLIKVEGSAGAVMIRDSHVRCDPDDVPIVTATAPGKTSSIDGKPAEPWDVTVDGLSVTGSSGADMPAMLLVGRNESSVRNSCINMDGNRDGILISESQACSIEDTNIWVPGEYIRLQNATATTTDITHLEECTDTV